jgi:hypothetical protein
VRILRSFLPLWAITWQRYINSLFAAGQLVISAVSFVISLTLIAVLFAAIYKVLPDKPIVWRDVAVAPLSPRCCLRSASPSSGCISGAAMPLRAMGRPEPIWSS